MEADEPGHLELRAGPPPDPGESLKVIVKVDEPGYVPEGFRVRARIDEVMFTADTTAAAVAAADRDPRVVSISASRPLQQE